MSESGPNQAAPGMSPEPGGSPPAAPDRVSSAAVLFEKALWLSRLLVLVAVCFALVVGCAVFFVASVDVIRMLGTVAAFLEASSPESVRRLRLDIVAKVVKVVDLYLVATFMLIFAMGLYELFIGKISAAEKSDVARRLLLIHDLDDLKNRLAKIVMLILALLFLEYALRLEISSALELLYLATGILLVSGSPYLSQKQRKDLKDTHP